MESQENLSINIHIETDLRDHNPTKCIHCSVSTENLLGCLGISVEDIGDTFFQHDVTLCLSKNTRELFKKDTNGLEQILHEAGMPDNGIKNTEKEIFQTDSPKKSS